MPDGADLTEEKLASDDANFGEAMTIQINLDGLQNYRGYIGGADRSDLAPCGARFGKVSGSNSKICTGRKA